MDIQTKVTNSSRHSTMPINTVEVLSLVTQVCEEERLQVPIKESLKGGAIAFATTTVGGLIAGPVGLAVGELYRLLFVAH